MNIRKLSVGLFSLLLLVSCGSKQETNKEEAAKEYPTIVLSVESAELEAVYPATVRGKQDVEIRPRVDGIIKEIYVDEGTVVRKGQKLFVIDSPQTEQAVRTAEASVNSAKAAVNTAQINVNRVEPLAQKKIVSEVQLQTAKNSLETAQAGLAQAQAALDNARASRSWATVTSPVDGVVGAISYRVGSYISTAYVFTTVANTSNVFAYFSLNEKQLMNLLKDLPGKTQAEKIKNLPEVSLTLADGSVYSEKGKIETISGVVNVTTGSANFRAEFPNKQGFLRSGTSGKVIIPTHLDSVFVIPQKATFAQQDRVLVYQVQGDSVVQKQITVEALPDGQRYAITSGGVSTGDRIVSDGIATLRNGQKIIVK